MDDKVKIVLTMQHLHDMDNALVDAYLHQQTIGNRIGGTFTAHALENIVNELKGKFPDKPIDKDKARNRMKVIKKTFSRCYDIFKNGISGFSWNPTQEMWDAEPEVWQKLIEVKPDAAEWKNKRIKNYWKLVSLYGQDKALGEQAECGVDSRRKRVRDANSTTTIDGIDYLVNIMDTMGDSENVDVHENVVEERVSIKGTREQESSENNPASSRSKKSKKIEIDPVIAMANALEMLAKATVESSRDLVNIFKPKNPIKDIDLWKYVEDIGIDQHLYYEAITYFLDNPNRLGALNAVPIDHRKNMLLTWIGHDTGLQKK